MVVSCPRPLLCLQEGAVGRVRVESVEQQLYATIRPQDAQASGGSNRPFFDSDFDDKEPREVLDLMSRAKRWLESRGYTITLKGTYTQIREIKF